MYEKLEGFSAASRNSKGAVGDFSKPSVESSVEVAGGAAQKCLRSGEGSWAIFGCHGDNLVCQKAL